MARPTGRTKPTTTEVAEKATSRVISPTKVAKSRAGRGKPRNDRLENWPYDHLLPTATDRSKNGRVTGRILVNWMRPRMIEKAWLHMLYECEIRNIDLPLDFVAHRLYPGATGEALIQRTDRLRKELIAEGHLVPPKAGKKGTNLDAKIRGHVRKYPGDADKLLQTRDVLFTEPMEDAQHADPTGFMLVHNRAARNKAANVIGKNNKGNAGNEHENLDSESTDEAAKSDDGGFDKDKAATPNDNKDKVKRFAKSLENPRTSARLRTAPKKSYKEVANLDSDYVVDADDEAVVNHKGGRSLNATHGYDHDDEEEEYGEDGDDLPTTESEGNHTNTTKRVTSQYQLPHDIAPFGAFDLTPGSFADEEDNIFTTPLQGIQNTHAANRFNDQLRSFVPRASNRRFIERNSGQRTVNRPVQSQTFVPDGSPVIPGPVGSAQQAIINHLLQLDQNNEIHQQLADQLQIPLDQEQYEAPPEDQEFNQMIIDASPVTEQSERSNSQELQFPRPPNEYLFANSDEEAAFQAANNLRDFNLNQFLHFTRQGGSH